MRIAMPASTLHLTFANRLVNEIQSERFWVTEEVVSQKDLVRFGALFPDLPYYEKIYRDLFFGYLGVPFRPHPMGDNLHSTGVQGFLTLLQSALHEGGAGDPKRPLVKAFLIGLLSHVILDTDVHQALDPLMGEERISSRHLRTRHTRIEVYQTILYHREFLGIDLLKENCFTDLFPVIARERMRAFLSVLCPLGGRAFASFPPGGTWEGFYDSFLRYQRLLGKGWIRWLYAHGDLEEVRRMYYAGPSFSFPGIVNAALAKARQASRQLFEEKE